MWEIPRGEVELYYSPVNQPATDAAATGTRMRISLLNQEGLCAGLCGKQILNVKRGHSTGYLSKQMYSFYMATSGGKFTVFFSSDNNMKPNPKLLKLKKRMVSDAKMSCCLHIPSHSHLQLH